MHKSVFRRVLALLLCITLLLQLIAAVAEQGLSVSVSYACSAPEPVVGSVLTFNVTGVGTVEYCVMVVGPDSMQTFLYGESSTYTITQPGLHIIIAYGTNNTDPAAPGFARCMSEQIWIEAGEGEAVRLPQQTLITEPESWAMAYVDRIAYDDGDLYPEFKRWLSTSGVLYAQTLGYSTDDPTNSGYLMLDYLLDNEYDYESSRVWFPWYKGVTAAFKLDVGEAISTVVQTHADGYGAQNYTDVLQRAGIYFVNDLMTDARTLESMAEAELALGDAFFEVVDGFDTLNEAWRKPLTEATYERLKYTFGRNGSDARKALREVMSTDAVARAELEALGVQFTPSGNVRMSLKDGTAQTLYEALEYQGALNTEAGMRFRDAYQEVLDTKARLKWLKVADGAATVLSACDVIRSAVEVAEAYDEDKQRALEWLRVMANASEGYMYMLRVLMDSPYATDQMTRGVERYYAAMEVALNDQLMSYYNDLDALAAELAATENAGEIAEVVYKAGEFVYDVFAAAGLMEALKGMLGVADATLNKVAIILLIVRIGVSVGENALESCFHITEKFEAAEVMYTLQQLMSINASTLNMHLNAYATAPTEERALLIIDLLRHQRALKRAGEDAAWAFVSIDMSDAIERAYEQRRDEYIEWLRSVNSAALFFTDPERTLTMSTHIRVNGSKVTCNSYYELAELTMAHGVGAISLQKPSFPYTVIELKNSPTLLAFVNDTIDIINASSQEYHAAFDETEAWIDSLYIP